jgi:hypothetical protein
MIYSQFESSVITDSQKEKFMAGLLAPHIPCDPLFLEDFEKSVRKRNRVTLSVRRGGNHLLEYSGSPDKRSPVMFSAKSTPQDQNLNKELTIFNCTPGILLYENFRELYDPVIQGSRMQVELGTLRKSNMELKDGVLPCGKISFIQEPGYKLRSVANPLRIHQMALKPFGDAIYDHVRSLPWDCTHDQTKAHPYIQAQLSAGETAHSVDLSNATDFFSVGFAACCSEGVIWKHQ